VVKWIGTIPVIGVCTVCDRSFTVPLPAIKRVADAQESLRVQFTEHKCSERMLVAEGQSCRPTRSSDVTMSFGWKPESICCFPI
jgi:hypothetical protein